jgi:hypothetical protein
MWVNVGGRSKLVHVVSYGQGGPRRGGTRPNPPPLALPLPLPSMRRRSSSRSRRWREGVSAPVGRQCEGASAPVRCGRGGSEVGRRQRGGRDHGGISSWGHRPHLRLPHTHPCRRGDEADANSLICAARTSSRPAGGTTEVELLPAPRPSAAASITGDAGA